ncbi:hypothetical protein BC828DRAFT_408628 [Blastocladiella britannica]|nr:hypothetical protein BC828DRAFT_408628 [Blastocladiella britannica]
MADLPVRRSSKSSVHLLNPSSPGQFSFGLRQSTATPPPVPVPTMQARRSTPPPAPALNTSAAQLDAQLDMMMRELEAEVHSPAMSMQRRPSVPQLAAIRIPSHHSDSADSGRGTPTTPNVPRGGLSVMTHGSTGSMSMALTLEDQGAAGVDFLAQMLGDLYASDPDDGADGGANANTPNGSVMPEGEYAPSDMSSHAAAAAYPSMPRRGSVGGGANAGNMQSRNRARAVHEIVLTETTYVEQLTNLVELVVQPLREAAAIAGPAASKKLGYSADDVQKVFGNVGEIRSLHATLLDGLRERYSLWSNDTKISDLFSTILPFLKMYQLYLASYSNAINLLASCRKSSQDFNRVVSAAEAHPRFKGLTIASFLILPIQRIPRYILLLENLAKYTPDSHPDAEGLRSCVAAVKKIADSNNEAIRNLESQKRAIAVQSRLAGRPSHYPPLVAPARKFLGESTEFSMKTKSGLANAGLGMTRDEKRPVVVFLFTDLLMIAKRTSSTEEKYEFKEELVLARTWLGDDTSSPRSPALLERMPTTPTTSGTPEYVLRLMSNDRYFSLYTHSPAAREVWAQRIGTAIHDIRGVDASRGRSLGRASTSSGGTLPPMPDMLYAGSAAGTTVPPSPTGSAFSGNSFGSTTGGVGVILPPHDPRMSRSSGGSGGSNSWYYSPEGGSSPNPSMRRPSLTGAPFDAHALPPSPLVHVSGSSSRGRSTDGRHRHASPSSGHGAPPVPAVPVFYGTPEPRREAHRSPSSRGTSRHEKSRERSKKSSAKTMLSSHGF